MDERYITAIDLGTSKIALAVAKVEGDNIQIIYNRETPSDGVRYSRVTNPVRAGEAIQSAVSIAEAELEMRLTQVVAGYPKYEVGMRNGRFGVPRNENECVTAEDIRNLRNLAMDSYTDASDNGPDEVLLGAAAQSFNCGEDEFQIPEEEVIGMTTKELEGNFKLFVGQMKYVNDMDFAFKKAGEINVVRKYFTPEATAKAVLYNSEMENGVALIDLGAGVTSVSIYVGNIMRHYAAVPFGGRAVTIDIKSICAIPERLAENIKMGYGACMPERLQNLGDKTLMLETDKALPSMQLSVRYLSEIITARETEIINAVLYEIQESGFADRIRSVVLTGGGAEMTNIAALFKELSGYSIRIGEPRREFFTGLADFWMSGSAVAGMLLLAKEEGYVSCHSAELRETMDDNVAEPDNGVEVEEEKEEKEEKEEDVFTQVPEDDVRRKREKKEKKEKKPKEEKPQKTGGGWKILDLFEDIMNERP